MQACQCNLRVYVLFQRVFVMPNMDDIIIPLMCDHLMSEQIATVLHNW